MCIYIYIYVYTYTYTYTYDMSIYIGRPPLPAARRLGRRRAGLRRPGGPGAVVVRDRGSAPKRGGHSTILFSTKCICAVAAW